MESIEVKKLQKNELGVPDEYMNIFKKRRLELGYSQLELSEMTGLPQQVISIAERLHIKNVKLRTCVKLSKVLYIDLRSFEILADD